VPYPSTTTREPAQFLFTIHTGPYRRNILIIGGDSIAIFTQRNARGRRSLAHFSGRKRRDLERPIPRHTEAVVVVLDRVGHALARKIRIEAGRRGLPIVSESAPI
jgi:hypothetical protein